MSLTAKQESFAQEWFATGNKSEAYRRAYPSSLKWKENTVNNKASVLSRNDKVLARFEELAKAAQKRNDTTVDLLDKMLKSAFTMAQKELKPSAMVTATMGLSKLHGLDAEARARVAELAGARDLSDTISELAKRLPS